MKWKIEAVLIFVLVITSCGGGCGGPPKAFKESDLVGTWQANYGVDRIDTITLKADGTFQQVYREPSGYFYESPWNKWYVEYRSSGRIYVHLEGMRYYVFGIGLGESGGRFTTAVPKLAGDPKLFYDCGEDRTIEMLDKTILEVVAIDSAPQGIGLGHMQIAPDSSSGTFTLQK